MDSEQTFFDRIEQYVRGTCSEQEKHAIEAAMAAADADFRKKAEEHILF